MRKAVTLPSTARDWKESSALARGAAKMKHDREARALSSTSAATVQDPRQAITLCGSNHSVQRSCSSSCAAFSTASDSASCQDPGGPRQHRHAAVFDHDRVHFGWLCIEASASKRAFRWRFCVVDGAHLSYFRDNRRDAECLGHHVLVNVERLHCVNRGLLLTDDAARAIWAHTDHETSHFEEWLRLFSAGIQYARRRRDGSIFDRPLSRVGDASSARFEEDLDASFTGWLHLRRRRLGIFSSARRHYVVLSGQHLSAFTVNLEGEWAKLCGRVVAAAPHKRSHWLSVTLESGQHLRLASTHPEVTASWLARMQRVLTCEM